MSEESDRLWNEALNNPGKAVDAGRIVICDGCSADYTDRPDQGGIIFSSNAYCPVCAPERLVTIRRYNEEGYIRATCPSDTSFADFVRGYRKHTGTNFIRITKG